MSENLFKTTPDTPAANEPLLYTQDEDGKFTEQLDIIYAPGTVFYTKSLDGTFEPESSVLIPIADETQSITLDFMIDTSIEFLRQKGFSVVALDSQPGQDAANPSASTIEISIMLELLKGLVSSHMTNHGSIDDACSLIDKIKAAL